MVLLLLCCDIVATSVDNPNGCIMIRDKQKQQKILADRKWKKL